MTDTNWQTGRGAGTDEAAAPWPPSFPHAEIDLLIERLREATAGDPADSADAAELLRLVAKEAQRLRTAVVRLSVARISAAEEEADRIMHDAQTRFGRVRRLSLEALDNRLDEAEALTAAMRKAMLTESRAHLDLDPFVGSADDAEGSSWDEEADT